MAAAGKTLHMIGYGSVGGAFERFVIHLEKAHPELVAGMKVHLYAPEITEKREAGRFKFFPCPMVTRETLVPLLDEMKMAKGDVLIEVATRIDTHTIWKEVKSRGVHFMNSGFDVWPDITLDLAGLDALAKDPAFSKGSGSGPTSVFSFGCNPGIASHFVRHGLTVATGIEDTREAAKAFGLRAVSFNERDTQWPIRGTKGEKLIKDTQLDILYNTWSPGNYIVETAESTILYFCCPEEVKEIKSDGPAVVAWTPTGPNIGFLAPHDETFTIQDWFDTPIPAVFVYEAPPMARAYLKGGRAQHSSVATAKLLCPAAHDLAADGYDQLGALLFSSKPGVAPFWCGTKLDVGEAARVDPTGAMGPTPCQVVGGVWSALQFILQKSNEGDCFPEDVPTPFVVANAFPWAGTLVARPAPEALEVPCLFDPGNMAESLSQTLHGEPKPEFTTVGPSPIHGNGLFVARDLPASTAVAQLSYEGGTALATLAAAAPAAGGVNHASGASASAYVDRNRAVRTLRALKAGEEVTINYSLLANDPDDAAFALGAAGPASTLTKEEIAHAVKCYPIWGDAHLRKLAGME